MKPVGQLKQKIEYVFTDIDDTLTTDGRLPADSYEKLWELDQAGVKVVPVTGRPAGWCEMIARMWPVHGVIGENGALAFQYQDRTMKRWFAIDEKTRQVNQEKLKTIEDEIMLQVPGAALASDQFTRLFDLAIDFCEDVHPLNSDDIETIVKVFKKHGAQAKVSSIHVNGWFGDYDKLSMCQRFYRELTNRELTQDLQQCAFIGDSPNDEPMFAFFEHSVAVANINEFLSFLSLQPNYVTQRKGGSGFVEFAEQVLKNLTPN